MSQIDMLRTVDEVRAAIGRGERVEVFIEGVWTIASDLPERIAHDIKFGRQFRIASPSRQAAPACDEATGLSEPQGSQVVSDDDVSAMVSAYNVARNYDKCMHHQAMRAAASALLARRPCAQGQGEFVMVPMAIAKKVDDVLARRFPRCRDCADENGTCPHSGLPCDLILSKFPAPTQPAPAGASTHAAQAPVIELPAWPTREEVAEFLSNVCDRSDLQVSIRDLVCIAESVHTKYFAGGRDGEGSK